MIYSDLAEMERRAIRGPAGFGMWCEVYGKILTKERGIQPLLLNPLQREVAETVEWCLTVGVPIRLIILKARQVGCSTISMALNYWLMRVQQNRLMVMGNFDDQADNLMEYFRTYAAYDEFDWGFECQPGATQTKMGNGSLAKKGSAQNPEKPRSGMYRLLTCTEVARWAEEGVANADDVLAGAMQCVPQAPGTAVILESTASGPSGLFYDTFNSALTLDEAKEMGALARGRFIRIFSPWHVHDDCRAGEWNPATSRRELSETDRRVILGTLDDYENQLVRRYKLDPEQVQFRRIKLAEPSFRRDPHKFPREFPHTPAEAFSASSPSVFSPVGMQALRVMSTQALPDRQPGFLYAQSPQRVEWRLSHDEPSARWIKWEDPLPGQRYLIAADFMTGRASDDRGTNRDHHAVMVIRKGYLDGQGRWVRPRLTARTVWPCQWSLTVLEEEIWNAHLFWGRCMIVPEMNLDGGVIRNLVDRGALVYEQVKGRDTHGTVTDLKPTGNFGFLTTGGREAVSAKFRLIEKLADAVAEFDEPHGGIDIPDGWTLDEMEKFVRQKDGTYSALKGEHDDAVMALAIGFACLDSSTSYRPPVWQMPFGAAADPMLKRRAPSRRGGAHSV